MPKMPSFPACCAARLVVRRPLAAHVPVYVERLERGRYASSTRRRCLNAVASRACSYVQSASIAYQRCTRARLAQLAVLPSRSDNTVSIPNLDFGAQYRAYAFPCQRLAPALASRRP